MSRLLFAAARGARVQRLWFKYKDEPYNWELSHVISVADESDYDYRIHPDDEAMQYGPISRALREAAIRPTDTLPLDSDALAWADWTSKESRDYWLCDNELCDNELHRSLFLLILAEALADEGL